jgi:hypothetical protein
MAKTRRKKHRTHVEVQAKPGETKNDVPRSFVMKRGKLSDLVSDLTDDVRRVMEPHTAVNLKESKTNKLKDFVQVSGPLGISHFLILSATDKSRYVKICRAPRGPDVVFPRAQVHARARGGGGAEEPALTPQRVPLAAARGAEQLRRRAAPEARDYHVPEPVPAHQRQEGEAEHVPKSGAR